MRKLYIFGLIGLAALIIGLVWADQMTFTTYYPAPYGVYRQFTTTSKTTLATNPLGTDTEANVGIGTTQPRDKLHVNGSLKFDQEDRDDSTGGINFDLNEDKNCGYIYGSTVSGKYYKSLNIVLGNNDVGGKYTVDENSQIGIVVNAGRIAPRRAGKILLQADKITLDALKVEYPGETHSADHVFDPAYKLESIEEHAKFMWKNRRLPAISLPEKIEDGQGTIDIIQDRKRLLEELEKAHIYIEQLNERIKKLEAKVNF